MQILKFVSIGLLTALLSVGALMWYSASLESQPQVQAMRTSLSLLVEEGEEYDKLAEKAHRLRLHSYELKFGHTARVRLEAEELRKGWYRDEPNE